MGLRNTMKSLLTLMLSIVLMSCAGGLEGQTEFSSSSSSLDTNIGVIDEGVSEKTLSLIDEVNEAEKQTQPAYDAIKSQEKKIDTINIISFLLALPFKTTVEPTAQEKLKNPITSVLNKILGVVDKAYSLDDEIREKLEAIVTELNPEIPSHAEALQKIDNLHIKLDQFDAKLDGAVASIMKTTNKIITKINLKIASYLPIDPRALLLGVGKKYFVEFKDDLQRYIDESEL